MSTRIRQAIRLPIESAAQRLALSAWLAEHGCTHIATEATGIYWRLVWHNPGT